MVKQRMASADVAGEVSCLKQRIVGLRLANIYDLNAKTYVLKLSKSGSDGEKVFLLLESGIRFHTVQVMYDKPDAPSNFTLKLRKHLRTRRLEDVRQLGVDRVVDFVFGSGDNAHHLILEMYAQGNVVLTDSTYTVLTLLRSHRDDDKGLSIMAKHPYPMHAVRLRQPLALAALRDALAAAVAAAAEAAAAAGPEAGGAPAAAGGGEEEDGDGDEEKEEGTERQQQAAAAAAAAAAAGGKKGKKGKRGGGGPVLKAVVADQVPYGPAIAEHCCLAAGLEPARPLASRPLAEGEVLSLHGAVQQFEAWLAGLDQGAVAEGFLSGVPAPTSGAGEQQQQQQQQGPGEAAAASAGAAGGSRGAGLVYLDYNPLRLRQLGGGGNAAQRLLEFGAFDDALDEFYSKIQGQRVQVAKLDAERSALSRLDKIRSDQGARAMALEREAAASEERAALIEYNLEAVDAAIDAVNAAIATGMDWRELEQLIRDERRAGNPVAGSIHSLQLQENKVTLLLSNLLDGEEEDEEALTRPATKVQADLGLSAYSNAAVHHAARKKQLAKQEKTLAAHAEALKAAEKKAAAQLAHIRNSASTAQVVRKAAWYERFHWFISSENYLVVSGRDAQQNELIVKRYFRKDDVYVHAELHGASSTIVRNHDPSRPVPPLTLQQAGCACVCRSKAWDSKVVTSAWWVHHHQVSKTAPTGEYLPTGSFMIRGKKNFLPPQGLVMGFGFMFKLEDSCIGRHAGERAVRGFDDEDGAQGEPPQQRQQQQQQQRGAGAAAHNGAEEGGEGSGSERGSSGGGGGGGGGGGEPVGSGAASTAASGGLSALDAFLDLSADQLAAAAAVAAGVASPPGTASGAGSTGGGVGGGAAAGGSRQGSAAFDRYGLEHPAASGGGEGGEDGDGAAARGQSDSSRRYISAAERARLKKEGRGSGSGAAGQQQQQQQEKGQDKGGGGSSTGKLPPRPPAAPAMPVPQKGQRGKKAKAAKAKEKYAEQDEEDRELALQLLGSAGAKKTRQERRQQRKAAREEVRAARGGAPGAPGDMAAAIAAATGSQFQDLAAGAGGVADTADSSSGADEPAPAPAANGELAGAAASDSGQYGSAAAEGASSDSDGEAEALAAAADEAERAEISALLAEENVAELPYDEGDAAAAALKELDSLTGCPRADDELLHAVPVCGPYAALAAYKYKVKLTPGTLKKGKAVKQAVELLVRGADLLQRERELMRAVPDADMVNAMVGTVKISAAGLQQLKVASKKAKKAAAQGRAGGGS